MSRPSDRQRSYELRGYYGRAHVHFRARYREVCWYSRHTGRAGSKIVQGGTPFADHAAFCAARRFVDGGAEPGYAHMPCELCREYTDELFLVESGAPLLGLVCTSCKVGLSLDHLIQMTEEAIQ